MSKKYSLPHSSDVLVNRFSSGELLQGISSSLYELLNGLIQKSRRPEDKRFGYS
jgi:hypothetical protein